MTYKITVASRRAAIGMCALVSEGDETAANSLLRMYAAEAMEHGHTPCEAVTVLAKSAIGVAVGLATDANVDADWFQKVGLGLAAKS